MEISEIPKVAYLQRFIEWGHTAVNKLVELGDEAITNAWEGEDE